MAPDATDPPSLAVSSGRSRDLGTHGTGASAAPGTVPTGSSAAAGPRAGQTGAQGARLDGRPVRRSRWSRWLLEWGAVVVVALGVALVLRTFVVQTFYIPSGSMEPTLMIGDRIVVDKLSYHLHSVHRGDIVVFSRPPREVSGPEVKDLVKRVIGLPGETISGHDGHVYVGGHQLSERWLPRGVATGSFPPVTVPSGNYFVMGDNRGDSLDSRIFGPIPRSLIVGHVIVRIWPLQHITFF